MRRIEALDGPVVRWSRPGSIRRIGAAATQTWWELRAVTPLPHGTVRNPHGVFPPSTLPAAVIMCSRASVT